LTGNRSNDKLTFILLLTAGFIDKLPCHRRMHVCVPQDFVNNCTSLHIHTTWLIYSTTQQTHSIKDSDHQVNWTESIIQDWQQITSFKYLGLIV